MIEILWNLLIRLTLAGSLVTLLLLVTRPVTRKYLSARWRRLACAGALLFFIFAIRLPAPLPEVSSVGSTAWEISHNVQPVSHIPVPREAISRETRRADYLDYLRAIGIFVWLGGAVLLTAYHLGNWKRFSGAVLAMSHCPDEAAQTLYQDTCEAMGIRRPPALLCCDGVGAPMLAGVFRPRLLLPDVSEKESLELVLRHELTHYKSCDTLLKWAALAVSLTHWFNPLIYVLGGLLETDCELACDERLALAMDPEQRKCYGKTILALMSNGRTPLSTPFSRKQQLKGRLEAILRVKKHSRLLSGTAAAILLVCGMAASSTLAYALPAPIVGGVVSETRPVSKISGGVSETAPAPVIDGGMSETLPIPEPESGSAVDFIPDLESYTDPKLPAGPTRELIRNLINSVNLVNGEVQFTIPADEPPQRQNWVIHIAGRSPEGISLHWLEAESDGKLWESGKTYSFPLDPAAFLGQDEIDIEAAKALCEMTVGLADAGGSEIGAQVTVYPALDWARGQEVPIPVMPEYMPNMILTPPVDKKDGVLGFNGYLGHTGIDYNVPAGKHVLAAADGVVIGIADDENGKTILIDHGAGMETLYSLCSGVLVKEGDFVKQGQALAQIARSGGWTPHLHFEVHLDGEPVDPSVYFSADPSPKLMTSPSL